MHFFHPSKTIMETLLNLCKCCIMPALLYSFKIWILTLEEQNKLIQIQWFLLRRILKIPSSTPLTIIFVEKGGANEFRIRKTPVNLAVDFTKCNRSKKEVTSIQLN